MKLSDDMDKEAINLCIAMNKFPGIKTIESCCGHGKRPYRIWFDIGALEDLPRLLYYFDECHCGFYNWKIVVITDCAMSPAHFKVEGPVGEEAYKESEHIADLLEEELMEKTK